MIWQSSSVELCIWLLMDNSMTAIARTFCTRKNSESARWSLAQCFWFATVLHSRLLVGTTKLCGKTLDHYYPAVVTDEEWERLQMTLAQNSNRRGGPRPGFPVRSIFPKPREVRGMWRPG